MTTNSSSGIGLGSIMFIVFLVLKLCDVITWSWWWVTAPLWIPTSILTAIFIFCFIIAIITGKYKL